MRTPNSLERSRLNSLLRGPLPDPRLGKAHNVRAMRAACNVDGISGCWLWRGAGLTDLQGKGGPRVWAADASGVCRVQPAARVAWILAGLPLEPGEFVCRATCFDLACINPLHGCACTPREKQQLLAGAGRFESPERARNLAVLAARRAIAPEIVRRVEEQIAADVPRKVIAVNNELSLGTVKRIRSGRHVHAANREPLLPSASIFALGRSA